MKLFRDYVDRKSNIKESKIQLFKQIELIKKNPLNIRYISNLSEKIQLLNVCSRYLGVIKYIINEPEIVVAEKAKPETVKREGDFIKHINDPCKQAQLEVVKKNINIEKSSSNVIFFCIINKLELLKVEEKYYNKQKLLNYYFQNLGYDIQKKLVDHVKKFVLLILNLDKQLRNILNIIRDKTGLI